MRYGFASTHPTGPCSKCHLSLPPFRPAPTSRATKTPKHQKTNKPTNQQTNKPTNQKSESRPVSRVLSWTVIHLGRLSPTASSSLPGCGAGHAMAPLFGLASGGVYPATTVASRAVRSYRTFSPLPVPLPAIGGVFSVALSVGSRTNPPGVTWHPALRSPDFPPCRKRHSDCPAGSRTHYDSFVGFWFVGFLVRWFFGCSGLLC